MPLSFAGSAPMANHRNGMDVQSDLAQEKMTNPAYAMDYRNGMDVQSDLARRQTLASLPRLEGPSKRMHMPNGTIF